jgi:hypothetical protein
MRIAFLGFGEASRRMVVPHGNGHIAAAISLIFRENLVAGAGFEPATFRL